MVHSQAFLALRFRSFLNLSQNIRGAAKASNDSPSGHLELEPRTRQYLRSHTILPVPTRADNPNFGCAGTQFVSLRPQLLHHAALWWKDTV